MVLRLRTWQASALRLVLAVRVIDRVLEVDVGFDGAVSRGRRRVVSAAVLEALRREGGRDGVRRSRQHGRVSRAGHGFGNYSSEAVFASGVARLGDVDGFSLSSKGHGDAGDTVFGSHDLGDGRGRTAVGEEVRIGKFRE